MLLDDGTTVYGGTLSTGNSGTVDIELGPSDITNPDATFDGVTVDNYFGTIEVSESSAATLLLDDSTTVYGGTLTIGNYGTLDIELGPRNIINPDATLDGVTLYNNSIFGGDIEVGELSSATLLLDDDTTVYGGTVTIGSAGELDIEGGSIPDVTLDGVNVDSNNSIEVGVSSDVTFTLDDGTKFEGGFLTIDSGSTLDVEYGSNNFSGAAGAALDNVSVSGSGTILVDSEGNGADLSLGGDTLVSGALLSIAATGTVQIGADVSGDGYVSPTLTSLTADNAGTIQIEPNATLLIGGTVTLNGGGTVELMTATEEFAGAIAGAGTGTLDNHSNTIIADGFGTGIGIGDQSLTFINESGGTVDADGNDSANNNNDVSIAINTGNAVTNQGLLEATNGGTLFIDDALNNSGTVLADGGTVVFSLGASLSLANIGSGAVQIAGGGIVEFLGPTDDQPDVTFAGPGTLEAASYHGTIIGFGTGDAIDLHGRRYVHGGSDRRLDANDHGHRRRRHSAALQQQPDTGSDAGPCRHLFAGRFYAGARQFQRRCRHRDRVQLTQLHFHHGFHKKQQHPSRPHQGIPHGAVHGKRLTRHSI